MKTATILLSRQPLRPSLSDAWVRQSVAAVSWAKDNHLAMAGSVGMQTWGMVTALASMKGIPMRLYVPMSGDDDTDIVFDAIARDFNLQHALTSFVSCTAEQGQDVNSDGRVERDERIVAESDILIPVSIRPGGRMERLIEKARSAGKTVIDRFRIDYEPRTELLAYDLSDTTINPDIDMTVTDHIIHWTRCANGRWPTERSLDYYRAILASPAYPRSAFDTLRSIAATQTIAASSRNMPGGIATVSLSDLSPVEAIPLMRWRARYRQMSFEPYGIGIERQAALAHGICPVRYYDRAVGPAPVREDIWKYQSVGTKGNWTVEREYRHRGDFNLGAIPRSMLLLFCHTRTEADQIEKEAGLRAVSFRL